MVDLSSLNYSELVELKKQLDVELVHRRETEKKSLLNEIQSLVSAKGYSMSEFLALTDKKSVRKASIAARGRYRNPQDTTQTWTGHGRKPQWAIEWLASGRSLEELRI